MVGRGERLAVFLHCKMTRLALIYRSRRRSNSSAIRGKADSRATVPIRRKGFRPLSSPQGDHHGDVGRANKSPAGTGALRTETGWGFFSGNARMSGHWISPAPCRLVRSWHCLERRLRSRRKSKLRWWRPQIGRKHCRIDGGEKRIPLGRFAAKGHESFRRGDKIARSQRRIIFHTQWRQAKRIFTVTSAVCH
jgi:hypothetical protein